MLVLIYVLDWIDRHSRLFWKTKKKYERTGASNHTYTHGHTPTTTKCLAASVNKTTRKRRRSEKCNSSLLPLNYYSYHYHNTTAIPYFPPDLTNRVMWTMSFILFCFWQKHQGNIFPRSSELFFSRVIYVILRLEFWNCLCVCFTELIKLVLKIRMHKWRHNVLGLWLE